MKARWFCAPFATSLVASFSLGYIVQDGDTLSQVARKEVGTPVYGNAGSLAKVVALNPKIRNANNIRPGETIVIPNSALASEAREPAGDTPVTKTETKVEIASEAKVSVVHAVAVAPQPEPQPNQRPQSEPSPVAFAPVVLKNESSFAPSGSVAVGALARYIRLDGRDDLNGGTTAMFLSDLSVGATISWRQNYSELWSSRAKLDWFDLHIQNSATKRFASESTYLASGEFEVARRFSPLGPSIFFGLGIDQRPFVRSIDAQTLAVEKVMIPSATIGFGLPLFRAGPFGGAIRAGAGWLGSGTHASFDVASGNRYFGEALLSQKLKSGELQGSVLFQSSRQSSPQLGRVDKTDLGIELGYSWEIQ
ncbi:hypothetical protein BH10BDE1_BH10BDE1_16830 [soil metagenome]